MALGMVMAQASPAPLPAPATAVKPEVLRQCGFSEVAWTDQTAAGLAWYREHQAAFAASQAAPALGLHVVMGPEFAGMMANLGRNLETGRVRLVQALLRSGPAVA